MIIEITNDNIQDAVNLWCNSCTREEAEQNYGGPIGNWDVSNVTKMDYLFSNKYDFNEDISKWNTSNVTSMKGMFREACAFNQPIGRWDVSNVTRMDCMFAGGTVNIYDNLQYCTHFNQPLDQWNVSNVTSMSGMFLLNLSFNQPISGPDGWDVSKVKNMDYMFAGVAPYYCTRFNQPLDQWIVSNVTSMDYMFAANREFNQPICMWDMSKVISMRGMFYESFKFNQPLNIPPPTSVDAIVDTYAMVENAIQWNQPIQPYYFILEDPYQFTTTLSFFCMFLEFIGGYLYVCEDNEDDLTKEEKWIRECFTNVSEHVAVYPIYKYL